MIGRFVELLQPQLDSHLLIFPEHSRSLLLDGRRSFMICIGHSEAFFNIARTALLESLQMFPCHSSMSMHAYNQPQLGQTSNQKPLQWIYTEFKTKEDPNQPQSPIVSLTGASQDAQSETQICMGLYLLSCCVIFEISSEEDVRRLKATLQTFEEQSKGFEWHDHFPKMFVLHKHGYAQCVGTSAEYISQPQPKQMEDQDYIQYRRALNTLARRVLSTMTLKVIQHVIVEPSQLLTLVERVVQGKRVEEAWREVYKVEHTIDASLMDYNNLLQDIMGSREILPPEIFEEAHQLAKKQALKTLSMKYIEDDDSQARSIMSNGTVKVNAVQSMVAQQMECLGSVGQQRNEFLIMEWGKKFLRDELGGVERRMGQIRSVNYLRHEMNLLREQFRKKTEALLTIPLAIFYEDFMFQKCFDLFAVISERTLQHSRNESNSLKSRISTLQTECRQLRKKAVRDESQALQKYLHAEQISGMLQSRVDSLQKSTERLRAEIEESKGNYEEKLSQMAALSYQTSIKLQGELERKGQEVMILRKEVLLLSSQIEKERLLHRQTHQNYEQVIESYRGKQLEMVEEIQLITSASEQEIELLRSSSVHQPPRIVDLSPDQPNCRNEENDDAEEQIHWQAKFDTAIRELQFEKDNRAELEIIHRIQQERIIECEIKINRLKKHQETVEKLQKDKEVLLEASQSNLKDYALVKQRMEFMEQSLSEEKAKSKQLGMELEKRAADMETVLGDYKRDKYKQREMRDREVQVNRDNSKLREALEIVNFLQKEYHFKKVQMRK